MKKGDTAETLSKYKIILGGCSNVKYKDSSWIYVLTLIFQCFFGFFGGILNQNLGPQISVLLGGWLMCLGILLSYFTVFNFYLFLMTYGILCGIGCGIAYPIPLSVAVKRHYDYKGVISGIIFIGRGLAVFLICPLQNYFINKYNYMPDYTPELDNSGEKYFSNLDILNKVPYLFIYEGIFFALIQFIGACLISDSGDTSKELMPFNDKNNQLLYFDEKNFTTNKENGISNSFRTLSNTSNFSYRESNNTFINRDFILIWLMIFFNWQAISYTQVFWKIFGLNYLHIDDRSLSILGGVSSIFNIFGRIFWGLISDLTSFKTALILMSMLMSFLTVTLTMSGFYGKITYSIWVCLIFFCHAGTFSIFPSITAHTFGTKNFGPIFGLLFTARAFSSIINAMISAAILNNIGNIAIQSKYHAPQSQIHMNGQKIPARNERRESITSEMQTKR
ncbi:monocarboxylate transporter, putative [Plasmodium ovale wallikeri]|uniref:Monocarboxylate transporter, putative n=1 Tax=Plasmodium ovale wallikeri TaxID=864142 RepID=A0A1A8YK27_PLAOA|nr:monocarboxylate transporter, putative [Plasmodium ovale wallikeri]SBT32248.1 monocarboxylate transporter, putative [Plasmodium ovale wallikeri]